MKVRVVSDVVVHIDPPPHVLRNWGAPYSMEEAAKRLETWAREFEEFLKDSKTHDSISLEVVRTFEERCSHCHTGWEVEFLTGEPVCCEQAILEWEKETGQERSND